MHKIPSMKVTDIARAINPDARHGIIGIRPGKNRRGDDQSYRLSRIDTYFV